MRSASRRPTGDDTVRKTRAHAVPPAELTITKARIMTESTRCCWTQCQTITTKSYPGGTKANPASVSGLVGHPVAVEPDRDALWELDHGLGLADRIRRVEDVERGSVLVG